MAGTSQPTIAAYEAGRKSPTLQTLSRIARAVGLEATVSFVPVMTREDRRSLVLHGRDLRKVTPFAGVLSANERARVYRNFARWDVAA